MSETAALTKRLATIKGRVFGGYKGLDSDDATWLIEQAEIAEAMQRLSELGHWWEMTMVNGGFTIVIAESDLTMHEGESLVDLLRQAGALP